MNNFLTGWFVIDMLFFSGPKWTSSAPGVSGLPRRLTRRFWRWRGCAMKWLTRACTSHLRRRREHTSTATASLRGHPLWPGSQTAFRWVNLSTNLYASLSFGECRQCLSNWEVQTWQMAPYQNRWDCAVLLKLVWFWFMHSTSRYGSKCKGHPCMRKELKWLFNSLI